MWCGVPSMWRGCKVIGRSFIMVVRGMPGKGQMANGNGANGKWLGSGGARAYNSNRWWQGPPVAPVAQLDRALPSEGRGQRFESSRVRH